jgi:PPOX class probable F420-dependent enzyme
MTDILSTGRPAERLGTERIAWLTTAGADAQPQSSPIWFVWDGSAFWLRSQASAGKVANVRANTKVALHLADDGNGGDIVTAEGAAEIVDDLPDEVEAAYMSKYGAAIVSDLNSTPEELKADYPTTLRITPTRTRAW